MSDMNPSPKFEEKVRRALDVPEANPEFVNKLRYELVSRPEKVKPRVISRPAWAVAFVLVLAVVLISVPGVAAAIGRLFGYVPGVGLVENTGNLRMLSEPVSLTRDGVTLTIDSVYVYGDRVEVAYSVKGIAAQNDGSQAGDATTHPTAFCGGVNIGDAPNIDGDARLKLPDGTILERDSTGLYPKNAFAMTPVYKAVVPANVTEMTLVLKCIPWARLGAVPENWEMPFKLVAVPIGMVVGEPVIDVNATSKPVAAGTASPTASLPSPQATFTLERVALTDAGPVFYIRLNVEHPDPSMVTVFPRNVYLIDSLGQKIQLMNNTLYSEDPSTVWEYVSTAKPAGGALTLVVEDAVAKYAPPDEMTFTFDVGENPQPGQTWELNKEFNIAGYKVEVASARAAVFDDIKDNPEIWNPNGGPDYPEGSQGFDKGYQFSIKPGELVSNLQLDILSDSCGLTDIRPSTPAPNLYYTQLCRDGYPKGEVKVILRGISVLVKNVGQVIWSPDGATLPATSVPVPTTPNITMNLERIVPMDSATIVYFSMDMENRDPSLVSLMPASAYAIDSRGQKIEMRGNFAWQPFEHRAGSLFEYTLASKPADGPLMVVVENAVAYYAPLFVDPPQATPEEMSFTFDAGTNPQPGQTWDMNNKFTIAGYPLRVTSARAATFEDIQTPDFIDGSQGYDFGYQFAVESDPSVKINVWMDIMSETPMCFLTNGAPVIPTNSSLLFTQLCRDSYPNGKVKVTIGELSVLLEGIWQSPWTP